MVISAAQISVQPSKIWFYLCFVRYSKHVLKQFFNLLQPFEPKIHMTESDFLSITRSGGTVILPKLEYLSHIFLITFLSVEGLDMLSAELTIVYFTPLSTPFHSAALAVLCDSNGCLGRDGFIQVMHDQIRTFTKSSLAETSRFLKLKLHAASHQLSIFYLIGLCLHHILFSLCSYLSAEEISFSRNGTMKMLIMDQQVT